MPKVDYFCTEAAKQDLKGKTVRGGVYTAVAQAGAVAIQLAAIPLLARLLTKEDFGLVEMGLVFTGFANLFVDAGMSMATIQRPQITRGQVSNLFWLSSGLGLLMAVVSAALSPVVAWFFGKPELVPLVCALGCSFLFSGLTTQHQALLVRAMQFREIAIIQITSQLFARAVAVYLAWRYESYWALVAGQVSQAVFAMIGMWLVSGWRPNLPSRRTGVRGMAGFGANVTGASTIRWFARNADNLLIGKFWGEGQLGAYAQAYKLFLFPASRVVGPLGNVAIPALSRLQDQPEKYRRYYEFMISRLAMAVTPASVFICLAADLVVPTVLGPGWEESVPILRMLSLAGAFTMLGATLTWLYLSQGRSKELLQFAFIDVPVMVLGFLAGLPWGALGVATAFTLVALLFRFPFNVYMATRKGPVAPGVVARNVVRGLIVATGAAGGVLLQRLVYPEGPEKLRCLAAFALAALFSVVVAVILEWTQRNSSGQQSQNNI